MPFSLHSFSQPFTRWCVVILVDVLSTSELRYKCHQRLLGNTVKIIQDYYTCYCVRKTVSLDNNNNMLMRIVYKQCLNQLHSVHEIKTKKHLPMAKNVMAVIVYSFGLPTLKVVPCGITLEFLWTLASSELYDFECTLQVKARRIVNDFVALTLLDFKDSTFWFCLPVVDCRNCLSVELMSPSNMSLDAKYASEQIRPPTPYIINDNARPLGM